MVAKYCGKTLNERVLHEKEEDGRQSGEELGVVGCLEEPLLAVTSSVAL